MPEPDRRGAAGLHRTIPALPVRDVPRAAAYYRDRFGFEPPHETGDFAVIGCPTTGIAHDFVFGPQDTIVFSAGTFDFHLTLVPLGGALGRTDQALSCTGPLCSDKTTFNALGYVHDNSNGFTDTLILIGFALDGKCIDSTGDGLCDSNWGGTYAATIVATGQPRLVPEPATLALLGLSFLGAAVVRRRRS